MGHGPHHPGAVVTGSHEAPSDHATIVSWNPGAERLYGYRADEILIEVSITISPILDAHGSVIGVSTIARDTSEPKRAVENLRFRALLDAAPDAMVIIDDTGTILLTNAETETERMFGYTHEAIIGESVERAHGYPPRLADSGAEGVRLAAQEQPNLILLDIRMPGMDGYEVAEALAGLEGTQIVAVTASAMPEDRQRIAAAGFNGYIQKSIDVDGFIEEIERLLAQAAVATGG